MKDRMTYGQRMSFWDRERDQIEWNQNFENAVEHKDFDTLEDLVREAIDLGYYIPRVEDRNTNYIISCVLCSYKK